MRAVNAADQVALAVKVRAGAGVELAGVALEAADLELSAVDRPGYASTAEGPLTVAVVTAITPELRMEGQAREIVHAIQNLRKRAGFEISDRIVTYYETDDATAEVFASQGDYIKLETLSRQLARGAAPQGAIRKRVKLEGAEVGLAVQKG